MEKFEILFKNYNRLVEQSYNRLFENKSEKDILKLKDDAIRPYLLEDLRKWETKSIIELEGKTPIALIDEIESLDMLIEVFKIGAKLCDDGLPDILLVKFKTYGDHASDKLMELVSDPLNLNSDEDFYISLFALRMLGASKAENKIENILDLLLSLESDKEIIIEEASDALVNIGTNAIEAIISRLDSYECINGNKEHLVGILVKWGRENKIDRVFKCLKSCFNKMEDKLIGAMYLGDYGDGRAIPALRGYLEKNRKTINYEVFCEIISAISRLGGITDDIKFNS